MLTRRARGRRPRASTSSRALMTTTLDKAANWARGNAFIPAHLRPRLLRDRDDVDRRRRAWTSRASASRPSAPRPRQADLMIISRPHLDQDGAGRPPHLRPDARAQVGDRDGRLLVLDGRLQQLRDRPGRQVPAGRRPRPGLPAAPRGADPRHPQAARDGHGRPDDGLARALRRRAAPRSSQPELEIGAARHAVNVSAGPRAPSA